EVGELVFELYWPEQKVAVAWLEGEAETNLNGIRVFPFGVDPERLSQAVKATGSNSNSNKYRRHEYVKEYSGRSVRRTDSGY
ncbi:MAG: hypothetical protein ACLTKH_06400, partial [Eubacterium sp.]